MYFTWCIIRSRIITQIAKNNDLSVTTVVYKLIVLAYKLEGVSHFI